MQQAYGLIRGSDASVYSGSGNFTVSKGGAGIYYISVVGSFSQLPVIVASPASPYFTAQVILRTDNESSTNAKIRLDTGYTDQSGPRDCDFSFIALWP